MAPACRPRATLAFVVALCAAKTSRADERQLHLDLHLGFASSSGPRGGPGAVAQAGVTYGLTDAFSLYASGAYSLAFPDAPRSPRNAASLAVGVSYAFDHLRVVPYLGLGARGDVVSTPGLTYITPSAELRGGLQYLVRRGFTLSLEAAYAYPFLSTQHSSDFFTIALGTRFTWDL